MSLKESLEKIKHSKEGLKKEIQDTRQMVKDVRPKPLRSLVNKKITDMRPLRRLANRFSGTAPRTESEEKTDG